MPAAAEDYVQVYSFIPNLIGYARIAFGLGAIYYALSDYKMYCSLYFVSYMLDAADGYAARYFNQSSRFGAVLDMVTDRATSASLLLVLSHVYPEYMFCFTSLLGLDICSHYSQMFSTLSQGGASHKVIDKKENKLLQVYYHNRIVLFTLCMGNEMFLMGLYLIKFYTSNLIWVLMLIFAPMCALKQIINFLQWFSSARALAKMDWADRVKK
mmetsp:Transcript_17599/g.41497  ORF Transcript_17599/g.41497 Transcript_17599/m.41497 type:complete len:212 (-) Transcript_17599:55-690(-)|eukprot:CAMPEP_0114555384 /NCGR_PEP_ID=MMETSP0114-20121206/8721_1 /TAXON_ID=31324 /ORGANISM="Goniomonas sp, Strain m" /LENGTH=211 /DNA_ID=CAMNT_0001740507 /DNA_START=40 /DNA_END=675 /DNA_ORIENTATION=-